MKIVEDNSSSILLTKKEAARLLAVSQRTIDAWMRRRLIPFVRIARTVRFRRADLENVGTVFQCRTP